MRISLGSGTNVLTDVTRVGGQTPEGVDPTSGMKSPMWVERIKGRKYHSWRSDSRVDVNKAGIFLAGGPSQFLVDGPNNMIVVNLATPTR